MSMFTLGQHAEAIAELKKDVENLTVKVDRLVTFVDRIDGGWKVLATMLVVVGAAIGGVVAFFTDYVKHRLWS